MGSVVVLEASRTRPGSCRVALRRVVLLGVVGVIGVGRRDVKLGVVAGVVGAIGVSVMPVVMGTYLI